MAMQLPVIKQIGFFMNLKIAFIWQEIMGWLVHKIIHMTAITNSDNVLLQNDLYIQAHVSFALIIHSLHNTMR